MGTARLSMHAAPQGVRGLYWTRRSMLRIRTLVRGAITAASGPGPKRGENECGGGPSGAMGFVAGSWIGWVVSSLAAPT